MGVFEICLLLIKRGLLPFPGALHKKRNIKKTCTSGTQNNLCKTTQECLRGKFIFSCELGFHFNANTDNFEKCAIFYFLSSRYFHISYRLAAISLFSCSSSTPRRCQPEVLPPLLFKPPRDSGPVRTRRGRLTIKRKRSCR